jgi:hypothetical protein
MSKPSLRSKSESVLRCPKGRKSQKADAMLIVRGYLDTEGKWNIQWEGMHWLRGISQDDLTPSGLPIGLVGTAAQELASSAAADVLETHAGKMAATIGENLGRGLLEIFKGNKS